MKKLASFLGFFAITIAMYCQTNLGNSLLIGNFGYQIKLDNGFIIHDTSILTLVTQTGFDRGTSNISDSSGNMKYVSDGFNIYHPNGEKKDRFKDN